MTNPFMIPQPFANNGNKNDIKDVRDPIDPIQTASWLTGFPPVTMTPEEAGGLPPNGLDMNGALNAVSQGLVHRQRGERMQFSFAYATSIGGYPKGAIIQSNDMLKEFQSLVDNNLTDPNTTPGAFWKIYAGDGSVADGSQTQKGLVQFATPQQAQDKLDIARAINPANALTIANSVALGIGQTWQDVTSSRVSGQIYTNNTGKPIQISIVMRDSNTASPVSLTIGGVLVFSIPDFSVLQHISLDKIIPVGATYTLNAGNNQIITWAELR